MQIALSSAKKRDVGEAMWAASSRRQYLLKTKAKYAYNIIIIGGKLMTSTIVVRVSIESECVGYNFPGSVSFSDKC